MNKDENLNVVVQMVDAFEVQLQLYMTYKYKVSSIDDLIDRLVDKKINDKIESGELIISSNISKINHPPFLDRAVIANILQITTRSVGKWEEHFLKVAKYVKKVPKYKFKDALFSIIENTNKERYLHQIRQYLEQFNDTNDIIKLLDTKL